MHRLLVKDLEPRGVGPAARRKRHTQRALFQSSISCVCPEPVLAIVRYSVVYELAQKKPHFPLTWPRAG